MRVAGSKSLKNSSTATISSSTLWVFFWCYIDWILLKNQRSNTFKSGLFGGWLTSDIFYPSLFPLTDILSETRRPRGLALSCLNFMSTSRAPKIISTRNVTVVCLYLYYTWRPFWRDCWKTFLCHVVRVHTATYIDRFRYHGPSLSGLTGSLRRLSSDIKPNTNFPIKYFIVIVRLRSCNCAREHNFGYKPFVSHRPVWNLLVLEMIELLVFLCDVKPLFAPVNNIVHWFEFSRATVIHRQAKFYPSMLNLNIEHRLERWTRPCYVLFLYHIMQWRARNAICSTHRAQSLTLDPGDVSKPILYHFFIGFISPTLI